MLNVRVITLAELHFGAIQEIAVMSRFHR